MKCPLKIEKTEQNGRRRNYQGEGWKRLVILHPKVAIRKETSVGRAPVFQLVAIAIFGPMICALLWALAYVASREALTRLRAFFSNFLIRFKKKIEQNGPKQNYQGEGSKRLPLSQPR